MYKNFEKMLKTKKTTAYRVSKETGIPQSTFTDWKKGRSEPKVEKLLKLCKYFEVPIEYFLKDKDAH